MEGYFCGGGGGLPLSALSSLYIGGGGGLLPDLGGSLFGCGRIGRRDLCLNDDCGLDCGRDGLCGG